VAVLTEVIVDLNLSEPIAMNVVMTQPWYNSAIAGVILGAIIAGGANFFRDIYKNKIIEKQQKKEAYGQLMGRKYMLLELYSAYYSASLQMEHSKYGSTIEAYQNKLSGMDQTVVEDRWKQSINFTTGQKAYERKEDTRIQLAKSIERFWTAFSRIQILFSYMPYLNDKMSLVEESWKALDEYQFHTNEFNDRFFENVHKLPSKQQFNHSDNKWYIAVPANVIQKWAIDEVNELENIINSDKDKLLTLQADLKSKIDDLLNYLKPELG